VLSLNYKKCLHQEVRDYNRCRQSVFVVTIFSYARTKWIFCMKVFYRSRRENFYWRIFEWPQ
jgi:hypothetical protein